MIIFIFFLFFTYSTPIFFRKKLHINQKNNIVKNGFTSDYTKLAYRKFQLGM